ncbi:putative secreted protein [[Clostridium] cellulosi]|uniref:Putative secreted protein n=1 Tax=[Clostridium] cellulosi TaxID=29343 RepID=A0A078KIR3_9FIRM|nr:putative secreted protein [[Clostridium] cellulosi]
MKIKSKPGKKITTLLLALTLMTGLGVVASAQTFGTALNGASNEEIFQVKYNGAAWNYPGSGYHWASFKYSRNGQVLLTKTAYNGRVEGSVWDDLIHWGSAYTTKFNWNHG